MGGGGGRAGRGGGGAGPPSNLRGANIPFGPPPNNPPTFSFNFHVKQEKAKMYQVEGLIIINVALIDLKVLAKLFLSILSLNCL